MFIRYVFLMKVITLWINLFRSIKSLEHCYEYVSKIIVWKYYVVTTVVLVLPLLNFTFNSGRLVAVFQFLSSLILVHLGNLMEMPSAVWWSDLLNSAPVISHTTDFWSNYFNFCTANNLLSAVLHKNKVSESKMKKVCSIKRNIIAAFTNYLSHITKDM